jgi:hypothetical protein
MRAMLSSKVLFRIAVGVLILTAPRGALGLEHTAVADIVFRGTSTLHGFEGSVRSEPFKVELHEDPASQVKSFSTAVSLAAADLTTAHKKRDKNMYKLLDVAHFKVISASIKDALLPNKAESDVEVVLAICGKVQTIPATLSELHVEGEPAALRLAFSVSLKSFGLKPPSVMGLIRVGDIVEVDCTVREVTTESDSRATLEETP